MQLLPWTNGCHDSQGCITGRHDLLVVLNALLGEVEGKEVLEEEGDHVDFHGSKLALLIVSQRSILPD
jgi:hypothetical protein